MSPLTNTERLGPGRTGGGGGSRGGPTGGNTRSGGPQGGPGNGNGGGGNGNGGPQQKNAPIAPRQPGPGAGGNGRASDFGSRDGRSRAAVDAFLRSPGAQPYPTKGGYIDDKFPDGSSGLMRPNGDSSRYPAPQYEHPGGKRSPRLNKHVRLDSEGRPLPTTEPERHTRTERVID
ncbi:MAG: hypothetical protein MI924_14340 [Chloroflexales bacterium]|nr:hypothetical protein [Chloroflexales bacterium]